MRKKITPPRPWQSAAIAVLTVAAVLSLTGCNVGQSSKPSASGTGGQSTGNVGLSASSLNFGSVNVGASKTMDITLTNSTAAGGANVTVSQVKATGTGFSATNTLPVDLAPGQSIDLSGFKAFSIIEGQRLEFRVDAFNAFNFASYDNPETNTSSGNFGRIGSTKSSPRTLQLALSYHF